MTRAEYLGKRIIIVDGGGAPLGNGFVGHNPRPDLLGKYGTIIPGSYPVTIRMDDGEVITGGDCWWMSVEDYDAAVLEYQGNAKP